MTTSRAGYVLRFAGAFALGVCLHGQGQPTDFSGSWSFEPSRSVGTPSLPSIAGSGAVPAARRTESGQPGQFDPAIGRVARDIDYDKLVVTQNAAELRVTTGGLDLVYKFDGSKNNVSAINRPGFPQGQTSWDGRKLIITTTQSVYMGRSVYVTLMNMETWSLDGDVLTIDQTETTRQQTTEHRTLVYTRATK